MTNYRKHLTGSGVEKLLAATNTKLRSKKSNCHSERSEESQKTRFFTSLRSVQNDILNNTSLTATSYNTN